MKIFIVIISIFVCTMNIASAGEIKSGTVINKGNYTNYISELKHIIFSHYYNDIIQGLEKGWITLPIIENRIIHPPKGFLKASKKNMGKLKVAEDNRIIGSWKAGVPFPNSETGAELGWNIYRRMCTDELVFRSECFLFSAERNMERSFMWWTFKKFWIGRTSIPPIPEIPGNNGVLNSKESIIISKPYDVAGFSITRIRYEDLYKDDDAYSYIPAIRRLRRLTGADVTDPMIGSDLVPDDFECYRQKINPKMSFKILGTKKFLVPCHYSDIPPKPFVIKNYFQVEWEIKPLFVLELSTNDPDYAYSKRILYAEKEDGTFELYCGRNYDQKGRLWRTQFPIVWARDKVTGFNCYYGCLAKDAISLHSSLFTLEPELKNPYIPEKRFSIKELIKFGR
ncbi:MAG: DUF1329 domain-containing protein [Thermodesulfobacteriota bacterium]|nr:DUF1329 domain-containing protein [Thermodesulfobacteriota bacterium]